MQLFSKSKSTVIIIPCLLHNVANKINKSKKLLLKANQIFSMKMSPPRLNIDANSNLLRFKIFLANATVFIPNVGSPRVPSREDMKLNKGNKLNFPINICK